MSTFCVSVSNVVVGQGEAKGESACTVKWRERNNMVGRKKVAYVLPLKTTLAYIINYDDTIIDSSNHETKLNTA